MGLAGFGFGWLVGVGLWLALGLAGLELRLGFLGFDRVGFRVSCRVGRLLGLSRLPGFSVTLLLLTGQGCAMVAISMLLIADAVRFFFCEGCCSEGACTGLLAFLMWELEPPTGG